MENRDIPHLRLLHNISMKGQHLNSEDLNYVLEKKEEFERILNGINEILEVQKKQEENL